MPGQPSPSSLSTCNIEDHGCADVEYRKQSSSSIEDDMSAGTGYRSLSSLDSWFSEVCDDPAETMLVPDAVVDDASSPTGDSPSPRLSREETDSSMLPKNGTVYPFEENNHSEDEIGEKWNPLLYLLQSQAPKPVCVACQREWASYPSHYGPEYHGVIDRHRTAELLGTVDGTYLIRETIKGARILSFMFDNRVYNYRLFYEEGLHYICDKKFESLEDVVQDGLITLYLRKHNVAKLMEIGRSHSMARKDEKSTRLKRQLGRRVKGLKGKAAWTQSVKTSVSSLEGNQPSSISGDSSSLDSRSPSPTHHTQPVHSKSTSPTHHLEYLIVDGESEVTSSYSTLLTSVSRDNIPLILTCESNSGESNLDVSLHRRSTPDLHGNSLSRKRLMAVSQSSPLSERRALSASAIISVNPKNRYSALLSTLRGAVKEDQAENKILKCATLDSSTYKKYTPFAERSSSYSASVAHTLGKVADYSIKGSTYLSRSSLTALAKHTTGPRSPYNKAHVFNMHSYIAPTWCEICHNFLWGLKHQGMQCKDCGMDIHKQCLPLAIRLQCFPNKTFVKRVYGVDLTTLVKLEGGLVPSVISECIRELEARGMTDKGIYRLSGHTAEILELKEKFNNGEKIDLSLYSDENIITGAVKLYLRELPIPLITFDVYSNIIKATAGIVDPESKDTDWQPLINALLLLPKAHYNTLKHLTWHLKNVEHHSDDNKMTARNLSLVFSPTLMRSPSDEHSLLQDLHLQKTFVEYLITNHHILFKSN